MAYMELESYFRINFALLQFHKWPIRDVENMMPWERDIYISLLIQYIEEENQKIKERQKKK